MKKDNRPYLRDIAKAIRIIEKYSTGINFEQFFNEEMRHDACLRQLEIIGEAANRLTNDLIKDYPEFPVKQAVEMRNFLIHGYDDVNLETVWKTIQEDLPPLKIQVDKILEVK